MDAEHAVGCCPTYVLLPSFLLFISQMSFSETTISGLTCGWINDAQTCMNNVSAFTFLGTLCKGSGNFSATTVTNSGYSTNTMALFGPLIQLMYQAGDLPGFHSTLPPDISSKHRNLAIASAATATKPSLADFNTHHTPGGAVVGIVVGGITGLVLLLAIVWTLLQQRQRRKKRDYDDPNDNPDVVRQWLKLELPGQTKPMYEVSGENVEELPAETMNIPQELEVPATLHELEVPNTIHQLFDDKGRQALPSTLRASLHSRRNSISTIENRMLEIEHHKLGNPENAHNST